MNYREALSDMGYSNICENAREYRMRPIYRDSGNNSSLKVEKKLDSLSTMDKISKAPLLIWLK